MDDKKSPLPQRRQGSRRASGGPSRDLTELWKDGEEIWDAWWRFADDRSYEKWHSATDNGAMQNREILMQADLFANIREGYLLAMGISEINAAYTGPEIIPADLFETNRNFVDNVFTDPTRLKLAGRSWVQVKITERKFLKSEPERLAQSTQKTAKKMGRPSKSDQIRTIIREIAVSGVNLDKVNQNQFCQMVRDFALSKKLSIDKGYSDPVIKQNLRYVRDDLG